MVGSLLLIFLVFCVVLLCVLTSGFRVVMGVMSYLWYLCLRTHSGVQHIVCCVFLRHVCHMLPVSLDCSFFVASSVFSMFIYSIVMIQIRSKHADF